MKYNPDLHHRRSIRLRGYDYSNAGAYFVTICLNQRIPSKMRIAQQPYDFPTFGAVKNGVMILNDSGKIVQRIWNEMPKYYSGIEMGEFIVMPDHVHGIIEITLNANRHKISLPYLIDRFKTGTTNKYIDGVKTFKWKSFRKKLWQRNYWESIIRNEKGYAKVTEYIRNNPILWEKI
jgi:REP element-mobilizing transposase RayT